MSFRCDQCNEAQPCGSSPNMVVTEWYENRQIKREKKMCDKCAGKTTTPIVPSTDTTPVIADNAIAVKIEIPQ